MMCILFSRTRRWLCKWVTLISFRILARGISAVVRFHNRSETKTMLFFKSQFHLFWLQSFLSIFKLFEKIEKYIWAIIVRTHSSIIVRFKSCCSHLNFRSRTCFKQGVPWHSGNYKVWIHSETPMWHDKNIVWPPTLTNLW